MRLPDDDQKFNEEIKMRSERKAPIPGTVNSAKLALFMRPGGASKEDLKASINYSVPLNTGLKLKLSGCSNAIPLLKRIWVMGVI